jgi:hypothetical protein
VGWTIEHGPPPDNVVVLRGDPSAVDLDGVRSYVFREPDLDDALTAVALGPEAWRRLSSLPLWR